MKFLFPKTLRPSQTAGKTNNYSKHSTINHACCRDWSRTSASERATTYTTRHPFSLSSSMTLTQDTHLLGIITHFQALSAIIAPSCYAASLYSLSNCLSVSKSRFVGGRGRIRTSFILSNMHQSSVVFRASPIAPLPFAGLSRLSSQEPQSALWLYDDCLVFHSVYLIQQLSTSL